MPQQHENAKLLCLKMHVQRQRRSAPPHFPDEAILKASLASCSSVKRRPFEAEEVPSPDMKRALHWECQARRARDEDDR